MEVESQTFLASIWRFKCENYHQFATGRRKKNSIIRLKEYSRVWKERGSGIERVVLDYFQMLFCSEKGDMEAILQCVRSNVSDIQNEELCQLFRREEVHKAIFLMHLDKAPEEDGLSPGFF